MKKIKLKPFKLLATGILFMNGGDLINHFISMNPDLNDFLKGFGFSLVLASLWCLKRQRNL